MQATKREDRVSKSGTDGRRLTVTEGSGPDDDASTVADGSSRGSVHGSSYESARPNRDARASGTVHGNVGVHHDRPAVPIRTVIMLTPDGGGMRMAQMRDNSQAIERGTGKKQP